ncbi:MAG: NUDIX domain-containing protein [Anaerolineales bacterium]|nr:NUDIX domain-containing protein [Anaerolineales bacterium]
MPYHKNAHCSYCGHPFEARQAWPRTCANCGQTSFLNPLPVAILLLPVDNGLLVVRREIPPQQGWLALPGGFINFDETWQAAAARELFEETGVTITPADIRDFCTLSGREGYILVFGVGPALTAADLPPFEPNEEASERLVITGPTDLAFPTHTEAAARFFQKR